jgi:hypothetical protein
VNTVPWKSEHARGNRQVRRPTFLHAQDGRDRRAEPAHGPDREVDLTEQQHQHDANRNEADRRHLKHQVRQVAGAEEGRLLDVEDQPDHRERDDDPQLSEVAGDEAPQQFELGAADLDFLFDCCVGCAHRCPPFADAPVIAATTWS